MKKIFTSFILFLSFAVSATAFSSRLTISSSTDNANIRVQVDGKNYPLARNGKDDIIIDDLRAGYHSVKVFSVVSNRRGWGNQGNNTKLLYSGNINIRSGYHTDIAINRFGRAFLDERQIQRYDDDDNNDYDNYDWNRQPMNERSFEQLKQSVRRESFDDTKLSIAKTAIIDQAVNTTQVRELLGLFSFEQNKLDIAKFCYRYTTDYNNYYLVANSFGFSASKQDLLRYIEQNRRQ